MSSKNQHEHVPIKIFAWRHSEKYLQKSWKCDRCFTATLATGAGTGSKTLFEFTSSPLECGEFAFFSSKDSSSFDGEAVEGDCWDLM